MRAFGEGNEKIKMTFGSWSIVMNFFSLARLNKEDCNFVLSGFVYILFTKKIRKNEIHQIRTRMIVASYNGIHMPAKRNILFCKTHTLFTPRIPVNTPCLGPFQDMFSLSNCLPNSLLEHFPFYSGVFHKDVSKSSFVWPYCWHSSSTIVYSITRNQR